MDCRRAPPCRLRSGRAGRSSIRRAARTRCRFAGSARASRSHSRRVGLGGAGGAGAGRAVMPAGAPELPSGAHPSPPRSRPHAPRSAGHRSGCGRLSRMDTAIAARPVRSSVSASCRAVIGQQGVMALARHMRGSRCRTAAACGAARASHSRCGRGGSSAVMPSIQPPAASTHENSVASFASGVAARTMSPIQARSSVQGRSAEIGCSPGTTGTTSVFDGGTGSNPRRCWLVPPVPPGTTDFDDAGGKSAAAAVPQGELLERATFSLVPVVPVVPGALSHCSDCGLFPPWVVPLVSSAVVPGGTTDARTRSFASAELSCPRLTALLLPESRF